VTAAPACLGVACNTFGTADTASVANDAGDATADSTISGEASSGIAWVQSNAGSSSTLAFDRPVTAHNAIVVALYVFPQSARPSVGDSLGNAYSTVATGSQRTTINCSTSRRPSTSWADPTPSR
jgi:hypothetical protein